ncbi:alpha/beta fold hydrolase [Bradyrhizobium sp. CCBAU 51765]|uniref:alpha/beta fold hydrolase n=1 Tax=Bradyrhizobium sp. CCBAU 51765 TaxID=1325102 RepID=UPI0018897602|nr:hypothetical protein XH96_11435 [Bradyrhizobium sp. CCBAU 51765]
MLLLHGGFANSSYRALQARALVHSSYRVILVDSRGHGRSTRHDRGFSYDLVADAGARLGGGRRIIWGHQAIAYRAHCGSNSWCLFADIAEGQPFRVHAGSRHVH